MIRGWKETGIYHRGEPIYQHRLTGQLAREADGERLVGLDPDTQLAIESVLMQDFIVIHLDVQTRIN